MTGAQPFFARHESFYPRFGWLWKAVSASTSMPDIFLRSDAPVELGVGKNMVRAIRYWGMATRIIEEYPDPNRPRRKLARPTPLGELIFGNAGSDPYLEDTRTLWLLHWILSRPLSMASAWELLFGHYSPADFGDQEALAWLIERCAQEPSWGPIGDASIRRDIQCIAQMYAPARRQDAADDGIDSPFRQVGILTPTIADRSRLRFVYGSKPGLTSGVIGIACLDYASRAGAGRTLSLSRLTLEAGSPGMVLRLGEGDIVQALEDLAAAHDGLALLSPAGVRQLATTRDPGELLVSVLANEIGQTVPGACLEDLLGSRRIEGEAAA